MNIDPNPRETAGIPLPTDAEVIGIRLSRSNLEAFLSKLDRPDSRATILRQVSDDPPVIIVVKAEEDAEHYNSAARQADVRGARGAMVEDGATAPGQIIKVPGE